MEQQIKAQYSTINCSSSFLSWLLRCWLLDGKIIEEYKHKCKVGKYEQASNRVQYCNTIKKNTMKIQKYPSWNAGIAYPTLSDGKSPYENSKIPSNSGNAFSDTPWVSPKHAPTVPPQIISKIYSKGASPYSPYQNPEMHFRIHPFYLKKKEKVQGNT